MFRQVPGRVEAVCSTADSRWFSVGLLAGALVVLQACQGNADFSDAMPAPVTLSAETYRSEIMKIDRLVFESRPFNSERRQSLAQSLEELSRSVRSASDSRFLKIESLEIRRLAEAARNLPSSPPPRALMDNWMRIRSNLFEDQAWFARSAADLPGPEPPAVAN